MNSASVSGYLGKDPEIKYTQSGKVVTSFSVGVQEYKPEGKSTTWLDISCWGKTAEWVGNNLHKGDYVVIHGRLEQQSWDDKNGGGKRSKIVIVADTVDTPPKGKQSTTLDGSSGRTVYIGDESETPAMPF